MQSLSAKLFTPGLAMASGTAWLVCDDHVLTAWHCIVDASFRPYPDGQCFLLEFASGERVEAVVAECSEAVDAALLRLLDYQFDTAGKIHFAALPAQLSERWRSWGYPKGRPEGMQISGRIELPDVPYQNGTTAIQLTCDLGGAAGQQLSGMSGAAVEYRETLVGLIVSGPKGLDQRVIHAMPLLRIAGQLATLARIMAGAPQQAARQRDDTATPPDDIPWRLGGASNVRATGIVQRANLVSKTTRLYGRDKEVLALGRAIDEGARLVTLWGCNGCGKTRLAQEAGMHCLERYDGVYMADLLACDGTESMRTEIANTLGVKDAQGDLLGDARDDLLDDTLALVIGDHRVLLILDSAQQLHLVRSLLAHLLARCPGLVIVAVREQLLAWDTPPEYAHQVAPLADCAGDRNAAQLMAGIGASPVLSLFAARAKLAHPAFVLTLANVEQAALVCKPGGGVPLAIEIIAGLAAPFFRDSRRSGVSLTMDLMPLMQDLHQLAPLAPDARLDALIARSAGALDDVTQTLFWRLSIFIGGCTLEAAEAIASDLDCEGDPVGSRLERLLVLGLLTCARGVRGKPYYRLQPAVLAYCRAKLDTSGKRDATACVQVRYYAQLASRAERRQTSLTSAELVEWFELLEFEYANLRNALAWVTAHPQDAGTIDAGLGIAGNLFWFWNLRGSLMDGLRWCETLLELSTAPTRHQAAALCCSGGLHFLRGDFTKAQSRLTQSLALWTQWADQRRRGFALVILGMVALHQNRVQDALHHERDAVDLFRALDDHFGLALALNDHANVLLELDVNLAESHYKESLEYWKELGSNWGLGLTTSNLGRLACRRERFDVAQKHLHEALVIQRRNRYQWGLAESLKVMGYVLLGAAKLPGDNKLPGTSKLADTDKLADATRHFRDSFLAHQRLGRKQLMADCLDGLSKIALELDKPLVAAWLIGAASGIRTRGAHALPPALQAEHTGRIELARASAGNDAGFDSAVAAGASAPFADVSREALVHASAMIGEAMRLQAPQPAV